MRELLVSCDRCKARLSREAQRPNEDVSAAIQVTAEACLGHQKREPISDFEVCADCLAPTLASLADRLCAATIGLRAKRACGVPFVVELRITSYGEARISVSES